MRLYGKIHPFKEGAKTVGRGDNDKLLVTVNGWELGITVEADVSFDVEHFKVYVTAGLNNENKRRLIYECNSNEADVLLKKKA